MPVCSDLENNHLVGTIPASVASLTALEILYAHPSFESTYPSLAQAAAVVAVVAAAVVAVAVAVVAVATDAVVAAAITEALGGAGNWPRLTQLVLEML